MRDRLPRGKTVLGKTTPGKPGVERPRTPRPSIEPDESELPETRTLARALIREPVSRPIRVLFFDVDGTLTDGVIGQGPGGDFRHFWVRDGLGLQWARDLGVLPVAISGRSSESVTARMADLGIECHQGVSDKVAVARSILERIRAEWDECVMVGDDLPDFALMKRVGWPIAVANAQPEIKLAAKTVVGTHGGRGAVREVVEMVLRHNGTWHQVQKKYEVR